MAFELDILGPDVVRVLDPVREARAAGRTNAQAQTDSFAAFRQMRRNVLCGRGSELHAVHVSLPQPARVPPMRMPPMQQTQRPRVAPCNRRPPP